MAKVSETKQAQEVDVKLTTPPLQLPDARSTAENALTRAMDYCAKKMGLASPQAAVECLKQGDGVACGYCQYSIAGQVAESLGALDENVKSVYVCDYDATPEDLCFGEASQALPIHMIVWTKRKTGALNSLVEALDRAFAQSYANLMGESRLAHILDVQVVDDVDVKNRTGYGALLSSVYHRPIQVWER
jgi:hypothetical protein